MIRTGRATRTLRVPPPAVEREAMIGSYDPLAYRFARTQSREFLARFIAWLIRR